MEIRRPLAVSVGGFGGGVSGTLQEVPDPAGPRIAVRVSDAEIDDVKDRLRSHDATTVDDAVTRHGGR